MAIKNYTSIVGVHKSLGEIQSALPYLTDQRGRTLYEAYQGGRLSLGCGEGAL